MFPCPDAGSLPDPGFALYVHWPFCKAKCPYCDFNSHVRAEVDQHRWQDALVREIDHWAARTGWRALSSIFFGGGTPSLMPPATVAAVIDRAARHWDFVPDIEITLEANPTSVEAHRFAGFRAAGVNRVSLGVQALELGDLLALGRQHDVTEALAAVTLAARIFPRFSFDLIYARPGQSLAAWEAELRRALTHVGGHLSLYQLTIEPGTRFHTLHNAGKLVLPDEETQALLFELTQAVMDDAGLPAYEVSNHARPGEESRHNLVYWRAGDWVGIGPGAHGRLCLEGRRLAASNLRLPERWLAQVERAGHGLENEQAVGREEELEELLMMGLRLAEGVPVQRLEAVAGAAFDSVIAPSARERLENGGFLVPDPGWLRASAAGRQRLNGLLACLLATRGPAAGDGQPVRPRAA